MVTSLSYWFLNITRLTKNSARTNKVERESTHSNNTELLGMLSRIEALTFGALWQHYFEEAPSAHKITLLSEYLFQNSKSLHLYQSLCAGYGIWFGSCLEQSCRFTSRDARSERKRLPRSILCFNNNLEDAQERREAWPDVFQSFCQNKTACGCVAGMGANDFFLKRLNE